MASITPASAPSLPPGNISNPAASSFPARARSYPVDLATMPSWDPLVHKRGQAITVGDMHANIEKMCTVLARAGVCRFTEEQYEKILDISDFCAFQVLPDGVVKPDFYQNCFKKFYDILELSLDPFAATRGVELRFLGDTLSDRGSNDILMLMVYHFLHQKGIPFTVIFSNHDADFMQWFEKAYDDKEITQFKDKMFKNSELISQAGGSLCLPKLSTMQQLLFVQHKSMWAMRMALEEGKIPLKAAKELYDCYLQHVKVIDCEATPERATLYSHAPIGLSEILYMAQELGVEFKGETPLELKETVDRINDTFTKKYLLPHRIDNLFMEEKELFFPNIINPNDDDAIRIKGEEAGMTFNQGDLDSVEYLEYAKNFPFIATIWSRCYEHLKEEESSYPVTLIHGHDSTRMGASIHNLGLGGPILDKYDVVNLEKTMFWITLDRLLGKSLEHSKSMEKGDRVTLAYTITCVATQTASLNLSLEPLARGDRH